MPGRRTIAAALSLAAAVACGANPPDGGGFDGGTDGYALTLVGPADLVVHPGEQRTLQVLLTRDQIGPVANASIHFEFQDGDPLGARIDAPDTRTDAQGVGTVSFAAGTSSEGASFRLVATAPRLEAGPVAFNFEVVGLQRLLRIVGGLGVQPSEDGVSAQVALGVSASAGLKIRDLDADTGAAIPGDDIQFTLPAGVSSRWSGSFERAVLVKTGAGGEAQAVLLTAAFAEATFPVTARPASGGPEVTFMVTIQAAGGASCATNAQCGPGQVCMGDPPSCQQSGSGGCDPAVQGACPVGYVCSGGACEPPAGSPCDPAAPACTSGYCCDESRGGTCQPACDVSCAAGSHCVPGPVCGAGSCVADHQTPDVTGLWLTRHAFSLRDALPAPVRALADALRLLDQAVKGKLAIPGLPGWLDSIVRTLVGELLHQYLPGWFQALIALGDDLFTLLTSFRAEGSMRVVRNPDLTHLKGTEAWTSLVFFWLPLCGDRVGGDPAEAPDCARIDLVLSDSPAARDSAKCKGQSLPAIAVQIAPFTATVSGTGPYTLGVDRRQVKLKMGRIILVLLDHLIALVTPYPCIDEITDCSPGAGRCPLLDCHGFGRDAQSATGGLLPAGAVDAACAGAVRSAGKAITGLLSDAWGPTADTLEFSGHATISGTADELFCDGKAAAGACAAQLGDDGYETALRLDPARRDGAWEGRFLFDQGKEVPGAWEAVRP